MAAITMEDIIESNRLKTDAPECRNELFFGKEDSYICEKVSDDTYISVAV